MDFSRQGNTHPAYDTVTVFMQQVIDLCGGAAVRYEDTDDSDSFFHNNFLSEKLKKAFTADSGKA